MTGFTAPRTILKLVFDDEELAGLEIRAYKPSVDALVTISAMSGQQLSKADVLAQLECFAEALIEWNLDDAKTGERVPATLAGVRSQEPEFALSLVTAWLDAAVDVPDPLGQSSAGGPLSAEASIPMDTLSQSQES